MQEFLTYIPYGKPKPNGQQGQGRGNGHGDGNGNGNGEGNSSESRIPRPRDYSPGDGLSMGERDKNGVYLSHLHFDDLYQYVTAAAEAPQQPKAPRRSRESEGSTWSPHDWDGTIYAGLYGWPEGVERLSVAIEEAKAAMGKLELQPAGMYDVAGRFPIVPIAVAGDPQSMFTPGEHIKSKLPVIRIVVPFNGTGNVNAAHYYIRGAAIIAHLDRLETMGLRTEVLAVSRTTGCGGCEVDITHSFMLKHSGQHIDLPAMAFALSHSGAQRRCSFALREADGNLPASFYIDYGSSTNYQKQPGDFIVFDTIDHDNWSDITHSVKRVGKIFDNAINQALGQMEAA